MVELKWQVSLYSYKEKYDSAFHSVSIKEKDNDLEIFHCEKSLIQKSINNRIVNHVQYKNKIYQLFYDTGLVIKVIDFDSEERNELFNTAALRYEDFSANKHYIIDDYDIYMQSEWIMCCKHKKELKPIWSKNLRHYLYSEVEYKDGIIYFSTQGNGGLFYALSIESGETLFAKKNSGYNSEFYWTDKNLLIADETNTWVLIDSKTGENISCLNEGYIKYRKDDNFIILHTNYNRSTKQYDATLLCYYIDNKGITGG